MKRLIILITGILIYSATASAQNQGFVIRGKVFDSKTREPIASASIFVNETFMFWAPCLPTRTQA